MQDDLTLQSAVGTEDWKSLGWTGGGEGEGRKDRLSTNNK